MFNHLLIMGSAEIADVKAHMPMAEHDRRTIKSILKKPFQALFQKEKKKEKKQVVVEEIKPVVQQPPKVTPVPVLLEKFPKLDIKERLREEELKKEEREVSSADNERDEEEDELANFTYKVVEDDRPPLRTDSHSSDSGYSEKSVEEMEEDDKSKNQSVDDKSAKEDIEENKLVESLKELKVGKDGVEKKEKKLQTVYLTRGPIKNRAKEFGVPVHPYNPCQGADNYRQINQINRQTFSGGQVLTKRTPEIDYLSEINFVLNRVEENVQNSDLNSEQDRETYWQDAMEYVARSHEEVNEAGSILDDFPQAQIAQDFTVIGGFEPTAPEPNPIEEFSTANHAAYEDLTDFELASIVEYSEPQVPSIFPTPPRSENTASPLSDPFNHTNSEYTLSPSISSPLSNSDHEKYQEIPYDVQTDFPVSVSSTGLDRRSRERTSSSSMTMKQYKDLQKDISNSYSKKECCQNNRRTCKQIFLEHMEKLKMEDRRDLCIKVAGLDLKTAYGVLHHILLSLSAGDKDEHLQLALFNLVCERVIAQKPELFLGDFGLSLLKSAVLRCHKRPLITRYLVQCVRTALKSESAPKYEANEIVFNEVDALGDNLLIACARAGDQCAEALSELVRRDGDERALFDVHHANGDGYNALHVACSQHSAECPREYTLHVLLQHGDADLWRGDVKGGDTALHLAINSPSCELRLVMMMFRHVDRKMWKRLAHKHNRSSVTPLEYARSAVKSTTRQNYPHEVLEFLKKCR